MLCRRSCERRFWQMKTSSCDGLDQCPGNVSRDWISSAECRGARHSKSHHIVVHSCCSVRSERHRRPVSALAYAPGRPRRTDRAPGRVSVSNAAPRDCLQNRLRGPAGTCIHRPHPSLAATRTGHRTPSVMKSPSRLISTMGGQLAVSVEYGTPPRLFFQSAMTTTSAGGRQPTAP